jgi:hypothetical protein
MRSSWWNQNRIDSGVFVSILYRTNQLEARDLLEKYQQGEHLLLRGSLASL